MIIGFLSGLFIGQLQEWQLCRSAPQRKRGMSYDNNRESYRCRERGS
jgi:hypothetical protein